MRKGMPDFFQPEGKMKQHRCPAARNQREDRYSFGHLKKKTQNLVEDAFHHTEKAELWRKKTKKTVCHMQILCRPACHFVQGLSTTPWTQKTLATPRGGVLNTTRQGRVHRERKHSRGRAHKDPGALSDSTKPWRKMEKESSDLQLSVHKH